MIDCQTENVTDLIGCQANILALYAEISKMLKNFTKILLDGTGAVPAVNIVTIIGIELGIQKENLPDPILMSGAPWTNDGVSGKSKSV